jgi:hypothetical protein
MLNAMSAERYMPQAIRKTQASVNGPSKKGG